MLKKSLSHHPWSLQVLPMPSNKGWGDFRPTTAGSSEIVLLNDFWSKGWKAIRKVTVSCQKKKKKIKLCMQHYISFDRRILLWFKRAGDKNHNRIANNPRITLCVSQLRAPALPNSELTHIVWRHCLMAKVSPEVSAWTVLFWSTPS